MSMLRSIKGKLSLLLFCLYTLLLYSCENPLSPSTTQESESVTETEDSWVSQSESARLSSYLDSLFQKEVTANTLSMHYTITSPKDFGITSYQPTLGQISKEADREFLPLFENIRAALNSYDYDHLAKEDRLTIDTLLSYTDTQLALSDYYYYDEILKPNTGIQAELPVLLAEYQFASRRDVLDYLTLLSDVQRYFDEILAFEMEKSDRNLFMPDFAIDAVCKECADFCAQTSDHYLITTFDAKLDAMTQISDEDKAAYKEKNRSLILNRVLPAYEGLSESLSAKRGSGKNDMGLCYLPKGKIYYENLVHRSTGSSHSVKELAEMTAKKREADLLAISELVHTNPDVSKQAELFSIDVSDPTQVLNSLRDKIAADFPLPAETAFSVKEVDPCLQNAMAPAFYLTAPIDDPSHNMIYINPAAGSDGIKLFTTLAHEGFPGHLYQTVMTYQGNPAPIRSLLNYPGYTEGWATYVEMMSYSYAGLTPDAARLLSCNQSALLSLYASCDMGIHYDGWTLSDTIRFFRDYNIKDVGTISDIYEYIVEEPAHYLKYYIGYLEFLDLREYAKKLYGENYSNVTFHQAVLEMGPAPFDLLKKYLESYVSE